jgi:hypothetical protein
MLALVLVLVLLLPVVDCSSAFFAKHPHIWKVNGTRWRENTQIPSLSILDYSICHSHPHSLNYVDTLRFVAGKHGSFSLTICQPTDATCTNQLKLNNCLMGTKTVKVPYSPSLKPKLQVMRAGHRPLVTLSTG